MLFPLTCYLPPGHDRFAERFDRIVAVRWNDKLEVCEMAAREEDFLDNMAAREEDFLDNQVMPAGGLEVPRIHGQQMVHHRMFLQEPHGRYGCGHERDLSGRVIPSAGGGQQG